MKIAIQGLGRMGMQIARKLSEDGHYVIAHNRSHEPIEEAVTHGAHAAYSKEEVVQEFGKDQVVVWIMLPAEIVDAQVDEWLKLIPAGSIIVDGGNSDYRLTQKLNEVVNTKQCRLVDVGTSGGVWGYENGFSMMSGSDDESAFHAIEPALQTLAKPGGAYHYFGPSGSGHFVKMTHNAIEYGMMESLGEGYRMLKDGPYKQLDLAAAGDVWQHHSVITSWLNELCQQALSENPQLEGIDGFVAESGEARWTLESAQALGIELPSIQAAFDVRVASQQGNTNFATKLVAAQRNKFGGHQLNKS
jgi:6-phosphogluconate dehydrogenase